MHIANKNTIMLTLVPIAGTVSLSDVIQFNGVDECKNKYTKNILWCANGIANTMLNHEQNKMDGDVVEKPSHKKQTLRNIVTKKWTNQHHFYFKKKTHTFRRTDDRGTDNKHLPVFVRACVWVYCIYYKWIWWKYILKKSNELMVCVWFGVWVY